LARLSLFLLHNILAKLAFGGERAAIYNAEAIIWLLLIGQVTFLDTGMIV
jgi:hypothetical protein